MIEHERLDFRQHQLLLSDRLEVEEAVLKDLRQHTQGLKQTSKSFGMIDGYTFHSMCAKYRGSIGSNQGR
jgi:hypothetical protein